MSNAYSNKMLCQTHTSQNVMQRRVPHLCFANGMYFYRHILQNGILQYANKTEQFYSTKCRAAHCYNLTRFIAYVLPNLVIVSVKKLLRHTSLHTGEIPSVAHTHTFKINYFCCCYARASLRA